jgi:hypothetical protein
MDQQVSARLDYELDHRALAAAVQRGRHGMGVLERDIVAACAVCVARARCEREYAGQHDRAPQTVAVPGHTQHLLNISQPTDVST